MDDYAKLNSQEAHHLKMLLRFKSKENPSMPVNKWSRLAIVVDSEVEDVKYLLEITE